MIKSIGLVAFVGLPVGLLLLNAKANDDTAEPVVVDAGAGTFVNWENHPLHGVEITPDGQTLLVTNTPDNRIEVYSLTGSGPVHTRSIGVGLDPVSVRARTNTEAWVVNHISDSVSIVDLVSGNVVRTIDTADEPYDVVFAGSPLRAFVACSQANRVQVFDAANPTTPTNEVAIPAEDPRNLAVSPDGSTVYLAVHESGNASTILGGGSTGPGTIAFPPNVVSNAAGPYGGQNPPPNNGAVFEPPIAPGNSPPIPVGLIVKKNAQGQWFDDNGTNWTSFVSGPSAGLSGRVQGWDMPDRDLAIINANTLSVTYATGLMNVCAGVAVNPATGAVSVVGMDAINEVRFEPNVNSIFVRNEVAILPAGGVGAPTKKDLNPHLNYASPTIAQSERNKSIGDTRQVAWNAAGTRGYVVGMGSNNVVVIDGAGNRAGATPTIEVGEGPTSVAVDNANAYVYVLNRFEGSLSVIDSITETEVDRIAFYDPTPSAIKIGRKHLYDTHKNSGLGQSSCASCHVDARTDRLGWDLGDPSGAFKSLANLNLGFGLPGVAAGTVNPPFAPFHPMKGPMATQTLQDIVGLEPHHWRGDRLGIEEFNPAFIGLLGDDQNLTPAEMQEFEDFLATIAFPPNPFRNFDNTLPASLPIPGHFSSGRFSPAGTQLPNGNAANGMNLYRSTTRRLDGGALACVSCHTLPTGAGTDHTFTGFQYVKLQPGPMGEEKLALVSIDGSTNISIKVPQLRNAYEKVGCEMTKAESAAGFGFLHDGSVDSLARFVSEPAFNVVSDQEVADIVAFLLAFAGSDLPLGSVANPLIPPGPTSLDTHAAVGKQVTVASFGSLTTAQLQRLAAMNALAMSGKAELVARGVVSGELRGYAYVGGQMQSDRAGEVTTVDALMLAAMPGSEVTFTVVPMGSGVRIGIDRDEDGFFDRDEADLCSDPADPESFPGAPGNPDCDQSGSLDFFDFLCFQNAFATGQPNADCDKNGTLDFFDFLCFQNEFAFGCP